MSMLEYAKKFDYYARSRLVLYTIFCRSNLRRVKLNKMVLDAKEKLYE